MTRRHSTYALGLWLAVALTTACGGSSDDAPDARPVESLFTIAVVADCHLTTNPDKETRLAEAVAWLNAEASARDIELVAVVGDIGWGMGVQSAKDLLDMLSIPYIPIIGDNEIHGGSEQTYDAVYAPHYAELATTLDDFERAPLPVIDPVANAERHLQNFSFDYRGLHIVGLDFNDRETFDFEGELAELQDFPGGTMPWLEQSASTYASRDDGSVILLSHIPMHIGAFDQAEMGALRDLFEPDKAKVYGNFAGHMHLSYETPVADIYDVYVTAATWVEEELPIRLIHVGHDGIGFVSSTEVVFVPSAIVGE
jgi:hypothetical protein